MERISVAGPWITQREIDYVADAVRTAWYGDANVYHARFEEAFARYIGVRHAVALPSCTSAIHLSLVALGVGAGDEVVVPDITWIASAAPVTYVGATTVFADVDPQTWCLEPASFERCITRRTKAVIPVDLYGSMADMDGVLDVARRHGVAVIEDAAEAIGSELHGRRSGSFGDTGVFSFHGSKTLTTGEGGMLVTDRDDVYARVRTLRDHGRRPGDTSFWNYEVAYKYKMSSMQAACGLAQLERIDELLARKRRAFAWYQKELEDVPGVRLNHGLPGAKCAFWMVTALVGEEYGLNKDEIAAALGALGIETRPFFHPLSSLPAYQDSRAARHARERNTVSYALGPRGINLPSSLRLTKQQVVYVCGALRDLLSRARVAAQR